MKLALLAFAISARAQFLPISGTVVDATTGSPMRRVRVSLSASTGGVSAIVTGADGKFRFDAPKGKYSLSAEYQGMRQPFGQSGPGAGFGIGLYAGPDVDLTNLVFRWFPAGAISGKIIDDRREPAENVLVQLIRESVVLGRKRLATFAWSRTNDRGEYRFGPLVAGTYYLTATGEPWYVRGNQSGEGLNQLAPAYAAVYYPNALDVNGASPLRLAAGAEVKADFSLRTISGANVHVRVPSLAGIQRQSANLSLIADGVEGAQGFQRSIGFAGDEGTIFGVPPGHYTVRVVTTGENAFIARKAIDVGSADVTVELQSLPAPAVSGKIVFAGAKPKSTVFVRLVAESNGGSIAKGLDANGMFSYPNAPVGKYRVALGGGAYISQIAAEGASFKEGVLDIVDGANIKLEIVAATETGRVKGVVMDGDKPFPGVLAILAREGSYENRGYETDNDGSFNIANVPVGEYLLFAIAPLDFEYSNPEAVRPYLASAKHVRVTANSPVDERITVTPHR